MSVLEDKTLMMSLLGVVSLSYKFSEKSVEDLFRSNGCNFDKELFDYYYNNAKLIEDIDSKLLEVRNVPQQPVPKKVAVLEEKKVEEPAVVDFSSFF